MTFKKSAKPPCRATGVPSTNIVNYVREQVEAAGGDPADVPDVPFHMMRMPEIVRFVGLSRASIYRRMARGEFPRPVPLLPSAEA